MVKLLAKDVAGFTQAFDDGLEALEGEGLGQSQTDPEVTMVIKTNGKYSGDDKVVDCLILIGASQEEITKELTEFYGFNPPVPHTNFVKTNG